MKQALDLGCLGQSVTLWLKGVFPRETPLRGLLALFSGSSGLSAWVLRDPKWPLQHPLPACWTPLGPARSQSPFQSVLDCSNPLGGYVLKGDGQHSEDFSVRRPPPGKWCGPGTGLRVQASRKQGG